MFQVEHRRQSQADTMSAYRKFIESAASQSSFELSNQLERHPARVALGGTVLARQANKMATTSSTPSSKQQYRRLLDENTYERQQQANIQRIPAAFASPAGPRGRRPSEPKLSLESFFRTDDPILLKWMQAMRFETELECLTALQARTLAIDEHSAGALSIRNSQVAIQELRAESSFVLDFVDHLIDSLPLSFTTIGKFAVEFSELWRRLMNQTSLQTSAASQPPRALGASGQQQGQNHLTIINCTPKKSLTSTSLLRPLDKLLVQIRSLCVEFANLLCDHQENFHSASQHIDNGHFECLLRKLKELYGKFVEISIRAECANIVRALNFDFAAQGSDALGLRLAGSSSSLRPVRPFEGSGAQLPLKWALIALWQLTRDDAYICRTLTERWQAAGPARPSPRAAKRLDYSTKYEDRQGTEQSSLLSDYQRLYQICQGDEEFRRKQRENGENWPRAGALSSALRGGQERERNVKQVSTIELLIEIIISQPNKHERLDMMSFVQAQAQSSRLVDLEELDQSVSAAIYTSNHYKVAALRILNHLCANDQAVKTILRCFSTPPPARGQPVPENKIIRSIFECHQRAQEHIYQNETVFANGHFAAPGGQANSKGRKRARQVELEEEFSDYGSRQTTTTASASLAGRSSSAGEAEEGDDAVLREAVRLLLQLTAPFHQSNQGHDYYTLIGRFSIESLVKYLTSIAKSTASREMLLLSLTVLANISFITTEPMRLFNTNQVILDLFKASKGRSKDLELRDQAVTILANAADKNRPEVADTGGLCFLLSCLESCPTRMANFKQLKERLKCHSDPLDSATLGQFDQELAASDSISLRQFKLESKPRDRKPIDLSQEFLDDLDCNCDQLQQAPSLAAMPQQHLASNLCLNRLSLNELAALERIHQKTAVAFARLSTDPTTTKMILKYGGLKQLIDLCKLSHKRNHSDTVLIACIAALRKMAKVISRETFRYYNSLDLIELELNQALEIYGNVRTVNDQPMRLFASDV